MSKTVFTVTIVNIPETNLNSAFRDAEFSIRKSTGDKVVMSNTVVLDFENMARGESFFQILGHALTEFTYAQTRNKKDAK